MKVLHSSRNNKERRVKAGSIERLLHRRSADLGAEFCLTH